jgi:YggT family protein
LCELAQPCLVREERSREMFILANFIIAMAQVLDFLLWAYQWILIARVVISWIDADPYNPIVRFIYNLTEPVLERVRERLPLIAGGFDLSPLVVWLAIWFIKRFLVQSLYDLAYALR